MHLPLCWETLSVADVTVLAGLCAIVVAFAERFQLAVLKLDRFG